MGLFDHLAKSLRASAGDIVFGMEDGTASVFGLVSGVALSASNGQVVLLAGATGAATQQDQARALARQTEAQREAEDAALAQRVAGRLEAAGASTDQVAAFRGVIAGTPGAFAAIRVEITPQNPMAEARPMAHALWMFISNLFAGAVPVVPFVLPFQEAHLVNHRHHCALAGARRRT
jgi:VIT1/CCC1 family predicted Fe2+/Mn2+ transporter